MNSVPCFELICCGYRNAAVFSTDLSKVVRPRVSNRQSESQQYHHCCGFTNASISPSAGTTVVGIDPAGPARSAVTNWLRHDLVSETVRGAQILIFIPS